MKVLIIGGSGFLSSELLEILSNSSYDISVVNRGNRKNIYPPGIMHIKADVKSPSAKELFANTRYDVIIDFVSYTVADLEQVLDVFLLKCKQFIFISTACVYRRAANDGILKESSPLVNANWDYSRNKADCESLLKDKTANIGTAYTIVRPYITYGRERLPFGLLPDNGYHWSFIERILKDEPIFVWDNGNAVTTLTHITDFTQALVGLIGNPKAYNESFHVVSNESYTWEEVILLIGESVGKVPVIRKIASIEIIKFFPEYRGILLGDRCLDATFDNSKIRKVLNDFVFSTSLSDGINEVIHSYKTHNYYQGIDYSWQGRIDRLISNQNDIKYNSYRLKTMKFNLRDYILYSANRYFPTRLATKITRFLRKI